MNAPLTEVTVFCDKCGTEEVDHYNGWTREQRFEAARTFLAGRGWRITEGSDLCPTCGGAG